MEYIVGEKYKLYREGEYLGIGEWVDDPHNGPCFLIPNFVEGFGEVKEVVFDDGLTLAIGLIRYGD